MKIVAIPGIAVALVLGGSFAMADQSLADVAKKEAERRKTAKGSGRVYTNTSLPKDAAPPTAAPAAAAPAPAPAAAADPASPGGTAPAEGQAAQTPAPMTEEAWSKRVAAEREALSRAQIFAESLQSRINALSTDFVNRDDPAQRNAIASDRQKALSELDRVKQEIADRQKSITAIQEEARRAGVPAGWVR